MFGILLILMLKTLANRVRSFLPILKDKNRWVADAIELFIKANMVTKYLLHYKSQNLQPPEYQEQSARCIEILTLSLTSVYKEMRYFSQ